MGLLERFRRPEKNLDPERLSPLVDKLLGDLRYGFITEHFNGDPEAETVLHHESYTVILKRKKAFYLARVTRASQAYTSLYPTLSRLNYPSLDVLNYSSVSEMPYITKASRYVFLYTDGRYNGYRGYSWSNEHSEGWSRLDLTEVETASLLKDVLKAGVDRTATKQLFEQQTQLIQERNWKDLVIRWPELEPIAER